MPLLQLRGTGLGVVEAVLFDKDGTLSISEPQLLTLAQARVLLCLEAVAPELHAPLQPLLQRAYGLLHISEISHEHIETPHTVLNVNDQMKVMIIDLDAERGRISLSTKALEPEPGDMLTDPQKVFEKAEEMAARYKQMLLEQAEDNEPMGVTLD